MFTFLLQTYHKRVTDLWLISINLSIEPVETATVNYGTSLPNEPFNTHAGTFGGTSKGVGIYGSEGFENTGPFRGIDILQCLLFFCNPIKRDYLILWPIYQVIYR